MTNSSFSDCTNICRAQTTFVPLSLLPATFFTDSTNWCTSDTLRTNTHIHTRARVLDICAHARARAQMRAHKHIQQQQTHSFTRTSVCTKWLIHHSLTAQTFVELRLLLFRLAYFRRPFSRWAVIWCTSDLLIFAHEHTHTHTRARSWHMRACTCSRANARAHTLTRTYHKYPYLHEHVSAR